MLLRLILLFYTLQVGDAGLFQYPHLVRVEDGSSVNLTCDIGDFSSAKCFTVIWFKLWSTSIPTLETYQNIRRVGSFVGNEIEKTCSLNLNNAQVNYSGTYYCALIRGQGMYMNGSTLVVQGNEIEKTCSLNLNNAQVNDSGTYYCALIRGQGMYMGNGSTLVVRGNLKYTPIFIM
ncbi:UNVERIFIED_CONTAM: hypothetical protein FKN15_011403 [Acipenser sinensis]